MRAHAKRMCTNTISSIGHLGAEFHPRTDGGRPNGTCVGEPGAHESPPAAVTNSAQGAHNEPSWHCWRAPARGEGLLLESAGPPRSRHAADPLPRPHTCARTFHVRTRRRCRAGRDHNVQGSPVVGLPGNLADARLHRKPPDWSKSRALVLMTGEAPARSFLLVCPPS